MNPMTEAVDALQEKRVEPRVGARFHLFVHVVESELPALTGRAVAAETIDISRRGMQAAMNQVLPEGTILGIVIATGRPFTMYRLAGIVRWHQDSIDGARLGIEFFNEFGTDYQAWVREFDEIVAWVDFLDSEDPAGG